MSDIALPASPVTHAVTRVDHFSHLPAPRVERIRLHRLTDPIVIAFIVEYEGGGINVGDDMTVCVLTEQQSWIILISAAEAQVRFIETV